MALLLLVSTSALRSPLRIQARGPRKTTPTMVMDFGVLTTVSADAAAPTALLVAGHHFMARPSHHAAPAAEAKPSEIDLYRETFLRYAGYSNELGEAFGPLLPRAVPFSYVVAIIYVVADTIDKSRKAYGGAKYEEDALTACALIEGLDALIWQLAASVALPGYTIHQVVAIAVTLLGAAGLTEGVYDVVPTAIGLATIPFIVKPLDELAEVGMDVTLRKVWGPYLESCEVKY